MSKTHKKIKQTKTVKITAKSRRANIIKWVAVILLIAIAVILSIVGYFTYSGGAMVLATGMAFRQIIDIALGCWENRLVIAEIFLEITALVIRILKHKWHS